MQESNMIIDNNPEGQAKTCWFFPKSITFKLSIPKKPVIISLCFISLCTFTICPGNAVWIRITGEQWGLWLCFCHWTRPRRTATTNWSSSLKLRQMTLWSAFHCILRQWKFPTYNQHNTNDYFKQLKNERQILDIIFVKSFRKAFSSCRPKQI